MLKCMWCVICLDYGSTLTLGFLCLWHGVKIKLVLINQNKPIPNDLSCRLCCCGMLQTIGVFEQLISKMYYTKESPCWRSLLNRSMVKVFALV